MAEEQARADETDVENKGSAASEGKTATGSEAAGGPPESRAQGILRDAIQKVMGEIERHENEAKTHLQQAAELRKDLRDSIAFLQKQGEKVPPTSVADNPPSRKFADESTKAKIKGSAGRGRKHPKKK
jgi:hypothetical protein